MSYYNTEAQYGRPEKIAFYNWLRSENDVSIVDSKRHMYALEGLEKFARKRNYSSSKLLTFNRDEVFATVEELFADANFHEYVKSCRSYPVRPTEAIQNLVNYAAENLSSYEESHEDKEPEPAQEQYYKLYADPRLDSLEKVQFEFTKDSAKVLIRTNNCKSHKRIEYAGQVPVFQKDGTIKNYLIPVFWCVDCQCWFTLEQTYKNLKKHGVLACTVMDYSTWVDYKSNYANYRGREWNEMSPLRMHGYCVNKQEDLSDIQRLTILVNLIEKGIMQKDDILKYLNFFLDKLGNAGEDARDKWMRDYEFIDAYKLDGLERVIVMELYKQ